MNSLDKSILDKIKTRRVKLGISQTKMAETMGISQTGYAKIESGVTESVSLPVAVMIAKALNVGFNELFDIDGDSEKIDRLTKEIEWLNKRIWELEEQLIDKRNIIQFLSSNDLLLEVAWSIERKISGGGYGKRDFNDLDSLIKELNDRPFDKDSRESIKNYILKYFDSLADPTRK
jgi:transcriptional regulator with XRE-family HTH domain